MMSCSDFEPISLLSKRGHEPFRFGNGVAVILWVYERLYCDIMPCTLSSCKHWFKLYFVILYYSRSHSVALKYHLNQSLAMEGDMETRYEDVMV